MQINRSIALLMLAQISEYVEAIVWTREAFESVDSAVLLLQSHQHSEHWGLAHSLRGTALTDLACYTASGEEERKMLQQTLDSYDLALDIFRSKGHTLRQATILNARGKTLTYLALTHQGDLRIDYLERAATSCDQGLTLLERVSDGHEYARIQNNKASALEGIVTGLGPMGEHRAPATASTRLP